MRAQSFVIAVLSALFLAQPIWGQNNLGTGLKMPTATELNAFVLSVPGKFGAAKLEKQFSLRKSLPAPGDQGRRQSCVAWAVGYGLMTNEVMTHKVPADEHNFADPRMSPNFLYHYCLLKENGDYKKDEPIEFRTAFDVLSDYGICMFDKMTDFASEPLLDAIQNAKVFRTRFSASTIRTTARNAIKSALADGDTPLPIGVWVDDAFTKRDFHFEKANGKKVWDSYQGSGAAGHAMLLIGWDDDRNAYEVMNSYGQNWGDGGYVWIDYNFFEQAADCVFQCAIPRASAESLRVMRGLEEGNAYGYCRIATKDENTGRFSDLVFDVNPKEIEQGTLEPGTKITVKRPFKVNLRPGMTIRTAKGLSLAEPVIAVLHPGEQFEVEELKAFTIKQGTETHYWVGGRKVED